MTDVKGIGDLYKTLYKTSYEKDVNGDGKCDWQDRADAEHGNSDGYVTKYEFTKMVHALDRSIGDDIIDQFFKKFDTNNSAADIKKENGKNSGVRNLNAFDSEEANNISATVENYWKASEALDGIRDLISKDPEVQELLKLYPDKVQKCIDAFLKPYTDKAVNGELDLEEVNKLTVDGFKATEKFGYLRNVKIADDFLRGVDLSEIREKYSDVENLEELLGEANLKKIRDGLLNAVFNNGSYQDGGKINEDNLQKDYLAKIENLIKTGKTGGNGGTDTGNGIDNVDNEKDENEDNADPNGVKITCNGDLNDSGYTSVALKSNLTVDFDMGIAEGTYIYKVSTTSGINASVRPTDGKGSVNITSGASDTESLTVNVVDPSNGKIIAAKAYTIVVEDAKGPSNTPKSIDELMKSLNNNQKITTRDQDGLQVYSNTATDKDISNFSFEDLYNNHAAIVLCGSSHNDSQGHLDVSSRTEIKDYLRTLCNLIGNTFKTAIPDVDAVALDKAIADTMNEFLKDAGISIDKVTGLSSGSKKEAEARKRATDAVEDNTVGIVVGKAGHTGSDYGCYAVSFRALADMILNRYQYYVGA